VEMVNPPLFKKSDNGPDCYGEVNRNSFTELNTAFSLKRGDKVLDIGCGSGIWLMNASHEKGIEGCGIEKKLRSDIIAQLHYIPF